MRIGPQQVVWIAGASGRVGSALLRLIDHGKYAVITSDKEVDITDLDVVTNFAAINRPDIVINCAALLASNGGTIDKLEAYRLNALGARNMAIASESVGATIVHFSTDDVYSGKSPVLVNEFDTPHPIRIYGRSKLAGETFVRELNPQHVILRSSWVYDDRPGWLFSQVLEAGRSGAPIEVAANQFSSPTSTISVAAATLAIIEAEEYGLFHIASRGTCSRFEFAKRILDLAGLPSQNLIGKYDEADAYTIELEDLMLELTGVYTMPRWEEDLHMYMISAGLLAKGA